MEVNEMDWYLDSKIQKYIRDFDVIHLMQLNEFRYYKDYNEAYEKIKSIELNIPYKNSKENFEIHLKFINVKSIEIKDLDFHEESILSFNISKLNKGWERLNYLVEDFEEQTFKFYCEDYKVLSVLKV